MDRPDLVALIERVQYLEQRVDTLEGMLGYQLEPTVGDVYADGFSPAFTFEIVGTEGDDLILMSERNGEYVEHQQIRRTAWPRFFGEHALRRA